MGTLRFEPSGYEIAVEPGTRVADVTDAHPEAEVPYSCRAASCATCRVDVREGAEGLSAPDAVERETLAICGSSPTMRLTCQLRVTGDVPRIVLRVVDPL